MDFSDMAKAAFATWNNQIAPVFDVSRSIRVVEIDAGKITRQNRVTLASGRPGFTASRLKKLEVTTLVCGAISRPLHTMVMSCGIEVIPFVAGNLEEIIQAWLCGALVGSKAYAMPGCRNTGSGRFNSCDDTNKGGHTMKGNRPDRPGGKQKRKKQGSRHGQGGGTATTQSSCICPKCGFRAPHTPGTPCVQTQCDLCGAIMNRP